MGDWVKIERAGKRWLSNIKEKLGPSKSGSRGSPSGLQLLVLLVQVPVLVLVQVLVIVLPLQVQVLALVGNKSSERLIWQTFFYHPLHCKCTVEEEGTSEKYQRCLGLHRMVQQSNNTDHRNHDNTSQKVWQHYHR